MKIIAISDIHDDIELLDYLNQNLLDEIDLLLIAGDLCNGDPSYVMNKLHEFDHDKILFVRDNHDPIRMSKKRNGTIMELKFGQLPNIDGIKIIGFPYPSYDPAAKKVQNDDYLMSYLKDDVKYYDIDIVLTHSPPFGFYAWLHLDEERLNLGSRFLKLFVERYSPRLLICGHMHSMVVILR